MTTASPQTLTPQLEDAWLSQLLREYRDICFQYQVLLRPPLLALSDSRRQLGTWWAAERMLQLSRHCIAEHPWSVTVQVLKHEMAHQMVSELHGEADTGHGPLFRQCCQQLGLDGAWQRASADLAEGLAAPAHGTVATEQGRQIIDKVRKLLALGSSDNEHEAALAVQRARQLLARHRLDFDAVAEDQHLVHLTIDTGGQTLPAQRKAICAILESCFAVRVICASTYLPRADVLHKTIELLGREEEVAIAAHCYHFLENRLQVLWQQNRNRFAGNSRMARTSYMLGLLAGFRETLERSRNQERSAAQAHPGLMPVAPLPTPQEQQRLAAFVAWRFPRLRRLHGRSRNVHDGAYREAVDTGRRLTLHPPVSEAKSPVPRLPR